MYLIQHAVGHYASSISSILLEMDLTDCSESYYYFWSVLEVLKSIISAGGCLRVLAVLDGIISDAGCLRALAVLDGIISDGVSWQWTIKDILQFHLQMSGITTNVFRHFIWPLAKRTITSSFEFSAMSPNSIWSSSPILFN